MSVPQTSRYEDGVGVHLYGLRYHRVHYTFFHKTGRSGNSKGQSGNLTPLIISGHFSPAPTVKTSPSSSTLCPQPPYTILREKLFWFHHWRVEEYYFLLYLCEVLSFKSLLFLSIRNPPNFGGFGEIYRVVASMGGASLAGLQDHLKLAREYAIEGLYDTAIIFFDGAVAQINKYVPLSASIVVVLGICAYEYANDVL